MFLNYSSAILILAVKNLSKLLETKLFVSLSPVAFPNLQQDVLPLGRSDRVLVRPDDSSRNLRLVFPNDVIEQFISITGSTVKLPEVTEEDLLSSILDSSARNFKITYDTINN